MANFTPVARALAAPLLSLMSLKEILAALCHVNWDFGRSICLGKTSPNGHDIHFTIPQRKLHYFITSDELIS